MKAVLAIDQGTSSSKALLMAADGRVIAKGARPVGIAYPKPGWVEQDADGIWQSVVGAVQDCLAQAPQVRPAALGISNQRETTLMWDRASGRAIGPCVSWQCRRSAPICDQVRAKGLARDVAEKAGLTVEPMFSAGKAAWLLDHAPGLRARAETGEICIGTIDSWLVWRLTNGATHATDASNASRTLLMHIGSGQWDEGLLEVFGIPRLALPEIRASNGFFGETSDGQVPDGIPITGVAGDSHASMFGHRAFADGAMKATYGTGASLMMLSGAKTDGRVSRTIAWRLGDGFTTALEGNIVSAGASVAWFERFMEGAPRAAPVGEAGGVYLVPAFSGLGAPYWDDQARAILCGMTFASGPAQVARAALESIAFQVNDVAAAMEDVAGRKVDTLRADGGASRNAALMQFQADISDRQIVRNANADLSAVGAAMLAGLGAGVWRDQAELMSLHQETDTFEPRMSAAERNRLNAGWRDAVDRATMQALHATEGKSHAP